uniref:SXP/RAL-2 family protein Ani s 5-like cation-binding domain-containing protein n=1 Tax=Panagrellus redivivus TaxID=6233 RepID=A0A7E4W0M9_PANRE
MSSVPESEQIRTAIISRQSVVSVPPLHPTVPLANEFEALSMYSYITPFTNMPQNNSFYTYNTAPPIPTRPPSAINFGHQPSGSVYVGQTINEAKPQPVKIESKLPRMSIPKFDGTIEKFPEFYQTFIERVDSQNITAQDKLSYLLQSLSGKAKAALDGYAATAENYERCLNLLKAEYGKNDVICRSIKETLERVSEPRYNIDSLLNFTN